MEFTPQISSAARPARLRASGARLLRTRRGAFEHLEARTLLTNEATLDPPAIFEPAETNTSALGTTLATPLTPLSTDTTQATVRNPQSKLWQHGNDWFALLDGPATGTSAAGTYVWKLSGTSWVQGILVEASELFSDVKPVGNADTVYAALYGGSKIRSVKLEYRTSHDGNSSFNNYVMTSNKTVTLTSGNSDAATIDIDSRGHMWVAYDTANTIEVRYSLVAPYTTWSDPIVLATTGTVEAEICSLIAFDNKIGVMWSNHVTKEWGFRYHNDADDANVAQLTSWSADETPGSQTDPTHPHNVGGGMADDHLNLKAASDGTIYAAIKTSYDAGTKANAEMGLLVRSTTGVWSPVYGIDGNGTRQIVQLNETAGYLRYLYAGETGINDIVYKDIPLSAIDPSQPDKFYSGLDFANPNFPRQILLGGGNNKNVASTKQSFHGTLVVIATSAAGTPYSLSLGVAPFAVVGAKMTDAGQYLFYNNSKFDGQSAGAAPADDAAIAVDKIAMLPGGTATLGNYSSYSRGINGIMVDLPNIATAGLTVSDFEFRIGNDNVPALWPLAPAPSSLNIRAGAGTGGLDRVTLIWPDGAIKNRWLQVSLLATAATGLAQPYKFYFGNAVSDSGNSTANTLTNATDEIGARNHSKTFLDPAAIDNLYDYDRDGLVNATDQILARSNLTTLATALQLISLAGGLQLTAQDAPSATLSENMLPTNASSSVGLDASLGSAARPPANPLGELAAQGPPETLPGSRTDDAGNALTQLKPWCRPASSRHAYFPNERFYDSVAAELVASQL